MLSMIILKFDSLINYMYIKKLAQMTIKIPPDWSMNTIKKVNMISIVWHNLSSTDNTIGWKMGIKIL